MRGLPRRQPEIRATDAGRPRREGPENPRRVRDRNRQPGRTLDAPDEIADEADRSVDIVDQQREVLGGLVDAARNGDFAEVRRLASKNEALNKESSSIAQKLGADACA